MVLAAACYWPSKSLYSRSEVWIRVDGVTHKRSPWVLDTDTCMLLSPFLFIVYIRGLQTMALGPNPAREAISSGMQRHLVSNGK